ncbi:hypothetical protein P7C73_g5239, partial [Tremellales sp. Uapishka_1]
MSSVPHMASEVSVLRTKAAAKRGPGATGSEGTETTWPKPEFHYPSSPPSHFPLPILAPPPVVLVVSSTSLLGFSSSPPLLLCLASPPLLLALTFLVLMMPWLQGPSTTIDNVTKEGKTASGFIIAAGGMFPLGCAIPAHTVLEYGGYFPPGTMFPDGVLVPIHARMVSVQPIATAKPPAATPEPVCVIM